MTAPEWLAAEIDALCGLNTVGLREALAAVPREAFLGAGPWTVVSDVDPFGAPRLTPDADPSRVYHNYSIAIDPSRRLFNGAPSLLCSWIDSLALRRGSRVLHVGCATGYYSALMAHVVGASGAVDAIEVDTALAARARAALAPWPWVSVHDGDGTRHAAAYDAILINAGMTHPLSSWLDALSPAGRMILPLTVAMPSGASIGKGMAIAIARQEDAYAARVLTLVAIYNAVGIRSGELEPVIMRALGGRDFAGVTRLRRDPHEATGSCWLHADGWCLARE